MTMIRFQTTYSLMCDMDLAGVQIIDASSDAKACSGLVLVYCPSNETWDLRPMYGIVHRNSTLLGYWIGAHKYLKKVSRENDLASYGRT